MSRSRARGGRAIDVFMNRLVKSPPPVAGAAFISDTPPVSARHPFNQPRGARANDNTSVRDVKLLFLADGDSEVPHPFIRAFSWHVSVPAHRRIRRRSSALFRTALTCGQTSVRACSSSLTTSLVRLR
jgi:hypothetical protein